MKKHFTLFTLLLVANLFLSAQPAINYAFLQDTIQAILEKTDAPGAQIAIFTKDTVLWQQNFGMADVANEIAVSDETFFRIGSISKTFTAVAAMQLVEQGKLHLDDKIADLVPDLKYQNEWKETHPIRLKHVLEHTTGFDDIHLTEYAAPSEGWTLKQGLEYHPHSRYARWKPGMHTSYCNSGPGVVAYIIEKVTGQEFEAYVKDNIFQPLGMEQSSYVVTQYIKEVLSKGYSSDSETEADYWHISLRPAGSINASVAELLRFGQFFLNKGTVDSVQILSPASVERMETAATSLAGQAGIKNGYGLYNYSSNYKGIEWQGHNGGMNGFLANLQYSRDLDLGVAFVINCTNSAFGKISRQINAAVYEAVKDEIKIPISSDNFNEEAFVGHYRSATSRNQMLRFIELLTRIVKVEKGENGLEYSEFLSPDTFKLQVLADNLLLIENKTGSVSPMFFGTNEGTTYAQQVNWMGNFKKVSAFQAYLPIAISALFQLLLVFLSMYALIWIPLRAFKVIKTGKWSLRIVPLMAMLSLIALGLAFVFGQEGDVLNNLGNPTIYSIGIFVASLVFGLMLPLFAWLSLRTKKEEEAKWIRIVNAISAVVFIIVTVFLLSEGIIGLQTWTY